MSSVTKSSKMSHRENGYAADPDISAAEAALKAKLSRKRTKTGCLTCRKRRIKCDEERPVCKNCIKSKRHCEGYNQRVVFKPPNFDFRPVANGAAHITFQAGPVQGEANQHRPQDSQHVFDPAYYYRPRAIEHYTPGFSDYEQQHAHFGQQPPQLVQQPHALPALPPQQGYVLHPSFSSLPQQVNGTALPYQGLPTQSLNGPNPGHQPKYEPPVDFKLQPAHRVSSGVNHSPIKQEWQHPHLATEQQTWQLASPTNGATVGKISPTSTQSSKTLSWSNPPGHDIPQSAWSSNGYTPRPELCRPIDYQPPPPISPPDLYPPHNSNLPPVEFQTYRTPEYYEFENHEEPNSTPNYLLKQAAIETQDDDYYDVDSEEEMEVDTDAPTSVDAERQRTLNRILELNHISIQELQTRRYDTFIHEGSLDHYRAEESASPLKNPATARVFAHFIAVTGPSLSIYERHPRNTSVLFTEGQVPFSQQGLWTYTLPMAALHHHGLLHAMLALASLHIARLRGASLTPSMQHYAWALKRIHNCVSHEKKRAKMTTIAATMLLGFYEVMTADHMKWNMHLAGSRQLFQETDFVTMTQQFRELKGERETRRRAGKKRHSSTTHTKAQDEILDQIHDVDERAVSQIVGREVRYDGLGRIVPSKPQIPPQLDLSKFGILKDLYWWYVKQDAYQSIVSGNALLLEYSRWADCPPRAPLGKADAVYGSFDHLMLLLGRIADFAARDRHRKLRQMEANGGQWRPAPGMKMPGPPSQQQQPPPTPVSATNGGPPVGANFPQPPQQMPNPSNGPLFYGMAPAPRQNVQMPSSYNPMNGLPTPDTASPNDSLDLHAATQAALEEYGRIRSALHAFSSSLGDHFAPLTSDEQPPMSTPFGPALFYRSYDIGCLWAIYHMAMIVAIRSHPHMHPAAHAAAAIAASETAWFAKEIGRIAAGIVPTSSDQPLNPALGAALCESCMPSFFAAIQYQSTEERHHTVLRIYSIAKRTGWGSAELIANGCETAWVKAAQAGRGPPYTRVVRPEQSDDPRLNGSWETLDPNAPPDERDEADRRLVTRRPNARLNWAIGIMGTEDDMTVGAGG